MDFLWRLVEYAELGGGEEVEVGNCRFNFHPGSPSANKVWAQRTQEGARRQSADGRCGERPVGTEPQKMPVARCGPPGPRGVGWERVRCEFDHRKDERPQDVLDWKKGEKQRVTQAIPERLS